MLQTASQTPGYHESGSKWHLAPNFTFTALSEDDSIEYAIDLVLKAKNKRLLDSQKKILVGNVELFINGTTVKSLINLTDSEWDNLNCIPLICKIYLRHLLCQSFKYETKKQILEYDFNWGINIDFNKPSIKQKLQTLSNLGFSYNDCCEAIIVTNDKSINSAINYALLDEDGKKKEYQRMKVKLNRMKIRRLKDDDYRNYNKTKQYKEDEKSEYEEGGLVKEWTNRLKTINKNRNVLNKNDEILIEIEKYKKILNDLKLKREKLQKNLDKNISNNKLILYENYVNGILSGNSLNIEQISEWKKYRNKYNITDNQHIEILKKFGYNNDDELDAIKTYVFVQNNNNNNNSSQSLQDSITKPISNKYTTTSIRENECVICYSNIASIHCDDGDTAYMLLPCNHICLCQQCANNYYSPPHHSQKCPLDCQQITGVKKVYFS